MNTFSSDNDPYSQHDFGSIAISEECLFGKVDR